MSGYAKSIMADAEYWRSFVDANSGGFFSNLEDDPKFRALVKRAIATMTPGLEGKKYAEGASAAAKDAGRWVAWAGLWAHWGFNCIDLSAQMAAGLLMTDPRGLDVAPARLPWPAVLVLVPEGFVGRRTCFHLYSLIKAKRTPTGELTDPPEPVRVLEYFAFGSHSSRAEMLVDAISDYRAKDLGFDGWTSQDVACSTIGNEWGVEQSAVDKVIAETEAASALITALVAYVTATGDYERRQTGGKRKNGERSRPCIWEIGKRVSIDRQLVNAVRRAGARRGAVKIESRHIVRGHYKRQVAGPARGERKTIWVQPYWRGPEGEKAWAHIYTA